MLRNTNQAKCSNLAANVEGNETVGAEQHGGAKGEGRRAKGDGSLRISYFCRFHYKYKTCIIDINLYKTYINI